MSDYLTITIASVSILISIATLYFSLFYKGKLNFPSINFIAAQAYATLTNGKIDLTNDRIVLPITCINSGNKARSVRFKAIVNGKHVFHNSLGFDYIKLPNPIETMSLDNFQRIAPSFVVMPRSSNTQTLGFTQLPYISNDTFDNLSVDVWYQVDEKDQKWKKAFRIIWKQWPKLIKSYSNGGFVSSTNIEFQSQFDESYNSSILDES